MGMNRILAGTTLCLLLLASSASASDYTLDIFGNANEDDTINMQDVTYTELIILEYRDRTELADGKYDGKINMQDVTQIELVILGKEKELTYIDAFEEAETVNKPVERLANLGNYGIQVARAIDATDVLLPLCGSMVKRQTVFFPEMSEWTCPSRSEGVDFEEILNFNPDAVQTNFESGSYAGSEERKRIYQRSLPGIPLISLDFRTPDAHVQSVRVYGYILDRREEAEEYLDWYQGYVDLFTTRTEDISEDERPRFIVPGTDPYRIKVSTDRRAQSIEMAGGYNIADEIRPAEYTFKWRAFTVDPEWVVENNPGYIFRVIHPGSVYPTGYETDDLTGVATLRQEILDLPELAEIDAVSNGNVYMIDGSINDGGGNTIIATAYCAKLFYPDLFEDIDPSEVHQEYVDRFCHIDFDVREHGAFVYPPFEEWAV